MLFHVFRIRTSNACRTSPSREFKLLQGVTPPAFACSPQNEKPVRPMQSASAHRQDFKHCTVYIGPLEIVAPGMSHRSSRERSV
jgi:hypothetical protein